MQSLTLLMFHHLNSYFSGSVPALIAVLAGLAILLYFIFRHWQKIAILSRNRSQLLSVSTVLLVVGVWQVYQSDWAHSSDEEFFALMKATPRPRAVTMESLVAAGLPVVPTYHNDNSRTGQNTLETQLTPDNVNAAHFGKLYSFAVDGYVYAQPLYMPQVAIPGNGIHNVVFVATQHDSVYAFDADSPAPIPLWHASFLNPEGGVTTLAASDVNATDIVPEVGITGTPVIDVSSNTLYVVAATKENGAFYHRLHALDITSGAEKFGGPRLIQASYPGTAQDGADGQLTFASQFQLQRAGLLLSKGKIYIAFASNADYGLYHGWVIAYDATTMRQSGVWVTTPDGYQGGIWMSGCGISADHQGNLYLSIANGPFDAFGDQSGANYSDSVVKLRPGAHGLSLADFFTPRNQAAMAKDDLDLGSAGVTLLPDQPGPYPHLAITSGKNGHIYVLNRDRLGGHNAEGRGNPQIIQEISGQLKQQMGTAAYWNDRLYFGAGISPQKEGIKAFAIRNGALSTTPVSQTAAIYHLTRSTVSVSANGNGNGIVWAVDNDAYYNARQGPAVLHAYDAKNLARELYNSNQRFARDNPGQASKFTVPTIAGGKVFVGTANQLSVFGVIGVPGE
jgi:hypothetical protein